MCPPLEVGAIVESIGIDRGILVSGREDDRIAVANLAKCPVIPKPVDEVGIAKGLDRRIKAVILEPDKVHGVFHDQNIH